MGEELMGGQVGLEEKNSIPKMGLIEITERGIEIEGRGGKESKIAIPFQIGIKFPESSGTISQIAPKSY
jgi:hypothetical protein